MKTIGFYYPLIDDEDFPYFEVIKKSKNGYHLFSHRLDELDFNLSLKELRKIHSIKDKYLTFI